MVRLFMLMGLLAIQTYTVTTHPVAVALERWAGGLGQTNTGEFAGIAKQVPNWVDLHMSEIPADKLDAVEAAPNGQAACGMATQWICNRTDNGNAAGAQAWRGPGGKFCLAACTGAVDTYAFVAIIE